MGREVGLSPKTLLQRFGSKRGLLLALAQHAALTIDACFAAARSAAPSPLAALMVAATDMARHVESPEALANHLAFLQIDLSDPDFHALALEGAKRTLQGYESLLSDAIAAREIVPCDVVRLARVIQAMTGGSLINWAIHRDGPVLAWLSADLDAVLAPYRYRPAGAARSPIGPASAADAARRNGVPCLRYRLTRPARIGQPRSPARTSQLARVVRGRRRRHQVTSGRRGAGHYCCENLPPRDVPYASPILLCSGFSLPAAVATACSLGTDFSAPSQNAIPTRSFDGRVGAPLTTIEITVDIAAYKDSASAVGDSSSGYAGAFQQAVDADCTYVAAVPAQTPATYFLNIFATGQGRRGFEGSVRGVDPRATRPLRHGWWRPLTIDIEVDVSSPVSRPPARGGVPRPPLTPPAPATAAPPNRH